MQGVGVKIRVRKTVRKEGEKRVHVPDIVGRSEMCGGIYGCDMMGVDVGWQRSQSGNRISSL